MGKNFFGQLVDLYSKMVPTAQEWATYAQRTINSAVVLVVAIVLVRLAYSLIRAVGHGVRRASHRPGREQQIATIESLLRSIGKYAIYIAAAIIILRVWNVPTGTLVVGSAVVGGAIGFGSQGLIQDVITGLSLLFENQLAVGDWVEVNGKAGVVVEVGLRAVRIRDALGQQHIIFNRSISMVSNFATGYVAMRVDLVVQQAELAEELRARLAEMIETVGSDRTRFVKSPEIVHWGRTESGELWFRIEARVVPFQHSSVQAELERAIKRIARALGIELPAENLTITFTAAKETPFLTG